jgi:hypothetical protein
MSLTTPADAGRYLMHNSGGELVKKYAPFPTARWWVLHAAAIAAVYTIGQVFLGR